MNRRDQKKGQQTAVVGTTPDGDLEVTVHWDEPNPGGDAHELVQCPKAMHLVHLRVCAIWSPANSCEC